MAERIEVSRRMAVSPDRIFALLRDPQGHVAIDASGMLQSATGDVVSGVGDSFVVHMDREALGDNDLGEYDVTVTITAYDPDREIAWDVLGVSRPKIGHVYGYRIEPDGDGAVVTSYCDWSDIHETWRAKDLFPVISEASLRATLGILERTVRRGYPAGA